MFLFIVCDKTQQLLPVVHVASSKLVHLTSLPTTWKDDTKRSQFLSNTCFKPRWNITDIPFINIKTVTDGFQYILLFKWNLWQICKLLLSCKKIMLF